MKVIATTPELTDITATDVSINSQRRSVLHAALFGSASALLGFVPNHAQASERGSDAIFGNGFEPAPLPMGFTLTSPTAGQKNFCLGFCYAQADIPSNHFVTSSLDNVQVSVKNRWPDGSVKFALIAGKAQLLANVALAVTLAKTLTAPLAGTTLTTASLVASNITASIAAGSFGTASFAAADWATPFQTWVLGAQMSSWIYRKPIGTDTHLVAWLEVRLFADGAVEVLPWIENGYLNVAAPTNKNALYQFSLNGTQRFSATIDLKAHQRTPLLAGNLLSYWLGDDHTLAIQHDSAYLCSTKMVPTYSAITPNNAPTVLALPTSFTPLQQGSYPSGMGNAGYHPSIGILPEWDVLYLTNSGPLTWSALQRNAYSAGRYGIHFRDENTHRPLRFSSYPTLVVDGSSGVSATGASTTNSYTPAQTGGAAPNYTNSHCPQLGYFAYLLTGRHYHLETAQFQATLHYLKNSNAARGNSLGVLHTNVGANTTRGAAWSLRSLAMASAISPDGDVLQGELLASVEANINNYHARYVAQANNPQGWVAPYSDYTSPVVANTLSGSTATSIIFPTGYVQTTDSYYNGWQIAIGNEVRLVTNYVGSTRTATVASAFTVPVAVVRAELRTDNVYFEATWMQDFFTAAFGYMKSAGLPLSSTVRSRLDEFFAWKARSIVGRLGGASNAEYLYRDAAPYTIAVAPSNSPDFSGGTGPWFADWGALYDATWNTPGSGNSSPGPRTDGNLRGGNFPGSTSYWGNLHPALAYAVQHGVAGALEAYQRLRSAPNYAQLALEFNANPVWSIKPPAS